MADKMKLRPKLRLTNNGDLLIKCTSEAEILKAAYKKREQQPASRPKILSPDEVHTRAVQSVNDLGCPDPDDISIMGEYQLQCGQYQCKTFRWLSENDPGYGLYLWSDAAKGPSRGYGADSEKVTQNLASLMSYLSSFGPYKKMRAKLKRAAEARDVAQRSGDDGFKVVGFGKYIDMTYKQLAFSSSPEHIKYCQWLRNKSDILPRSAMREFQKYLLKNKSIPPAGTSDSTTSPGLTPPSVSGTPVSQINQAPLPTTNIVGTCSSSSTNITCDISPRSSRDSTADNSSATTQPSTNSAPRPNMSPSIQSDKQSWSRFVSPSQEQWMKKELKGLGLLPGTPEYMQSSRWEGQSLWRTPPPGELQVRPANQLPKPNYFWVHPMFIWFPETLTQFLGSSNLPCITQGCKGSAEKKGLGKPRLVVGMGGGNTCLPDVGQYYIVPSILYCRRCKCSPWTSDQPSYLKLLPQFVQNIFPAHVTFRKAVCRSVVDHIRRSGRSPSDVANEINELLQLRYERANVQYLLLLQTVRKHGMKGSTLDVPLGLDTLQQSEPFGEFSDPTKYRGASISEQFIADTLISEYSEQRPYLYGMLKGTFGKYWRSDHTRTVAKKVELLGGVMWSYSIVNEFWEVVSWVMVDGESEIALHNMYKGLCQRYEASDVEKAALRWVDKWCCTSPPSVSPGKQHPECTTQSSSGLEKVPGPNKHGVELAVDREPFRRKNSACYLHYNTDIVELLDVFHCLGRLGKACTSTAHPGYSRFLSLLSAAFFIIDKGDLAKLRCAKAKLGHNAEPTKKEIRRHCRKMIPPPKELEKRVQAVIDAFLDVKDPQNVPLYSPNLMHEWELQKLHIRRGCLSDPKIHPKEGDVTKDSGGILYRLVKHIYLGGVQTEETRLPVWQPLRGTSQVEGLHPHQSGWVTGSRVSPALFQAQSFLGLARWNWKRAIENRQLVLPVFDPKMVAILNRASVDELGHPKYPDFCCSDLVTDELFGMEYSQKDAIDNEVAVVCSTDTEEAHPTEVIHILTTHVTEPEDVDLDLTDHNELEKLLVSSDGDTHTAGPSKESTKTVTSHSSMRKNMLSGSVTYWHPDHWPEDMVDTINSLLAKYKGKGRMDKVEAEYRNLVFSKSKDPSNNLRMTNRMFIQIHERRMNRRLEEQAVLNRSHEQTSMMEDLAADLHTTHDVPVHLVSPDDPQISHVIPQVPPPEEPPTKTKRGKKRQHEGSSQSSTSDSTSDEESIPKIPKMLLSMMKAFKQTERTHLKKGKSKKGVKSKKQKKIKEKKRKRKYHKHSGSNKRGRNCLYCGEPKSKMKGIGNLHHTHISRAGEPGLFYCPKKFSDLYGCPANLPFEDFRSSEFWIPALEDVKRRKEEQERHKEEAARKREEMGWKKPGISKK